MQQFHEQLKYERQQRGWTQRELGRRAGISRSVVSHLESGVKPPSSSERAGLVRALKLSRDMLGEARPSGGRGGWPAWQSTRLWEEFRKRPERYRLDRERPNWFRLRAARKQYPALYDKLLWQALKVHGRVVLRDLIHFGCIDSGLEAMAWLQLLVAGVIVSYVSLARLGWCRLPVLDYPGSQVVNDRLWPAFVFKHPFLCALFPQVRLKPWESKAYRLDFLACVRWEDRLIWVNVEVDGAGHDPREDETRTQNLRLPRVQLTEEDILAPDFMARLQRKLVEAVTA